MPLDMTQAPTQVRDVCNPHTSAAIWLLETSAWLIKRKKRWCQGVMTTKRGRSTAYCGLGALWHIFRANISWVNDPVAVQMAMTAMHSAAKRRGYFAFEAFNDASDTSHADVPASSGRTCWR
jgi:hypothetical protein